jgi:hypothetical protein
MFQICDTLGHGVEWKEIVKNSLTYLCGLLLGGIIFFCNKIIFAHYHMWISCLRKENEFCIMTIMKNVIMCCFTILLHFRYSTCISHSSCFDLPNMNINDEYG